uniref:Elastin n=1 Tax=Junco hyemalis TaxID=40217 RepID=A0A8C5NIM1_JUNHY
SSRGARRSPLPPCLGLWGILTRLSPLAGVPGAIPGGGVPGAGFFPGKGAQAPLGGGICNEGHVPGGWLWGSWVPVTPPVRPQLTPLVSSPGVRFPGVGVLPGVPTGAGVKPKAPGLGGFGGQQPGVPLGYPIKAPKLPGKLHSRQSGFTVGAGSPAARRRMRRSPGLRHGAHSAGRDRSRPPGRKGRIPHRDRYTEPRSPGVGSGTAMAGELHPVPLLALDGCWALPGCLRPAGTAGPGAAPPAGTAGPGAAPPAGTAGPGCPVSRVPVGAAQGPCPSAGVGAQAAAAKAAAKLGESSSVAQTPPMSPAGSCSLSPLPPSQPRGAGCVPVSLLTVLSPAAGAGVLPGVGGIPGVAPGVGIGGVPGVGGEAMRGLCPGARGGSPSLIPHPRLSPAIPAVGGPAAAAAAAKAAAKAGAFGEFLLPWTHLGTGKGRASIPGAVRLHSCPGSSYPILWGAVPALSQLQQLFQQC